MNQTYFDHKKLDVYRVSIEFVVEAHQLMEKLPKGNANLADQLHRASTSIALNIAEGAGEFSKKEKIRFYRIARRSATECAGILDLCQKLRLIENETILKARELLLRTVSMLTKMVR